MSGKESMVMTEGKIVKPLLLFILPMIGSSIFQQLYNTADFFFVGNLLGKTSAAAVGASSTLITCIIGLFSGISVGTSVAAAQAVGSKMPARADAALHSSVLFGLVGGGVLTLAGILAAPGILNLLNTPASAISEAVVYIRIYLLSLPMLIFYNMCAGALRACGDSRTPFRILVVCGFVNVAADLLFLRVIPLGVAGVAIATTISQELSAVLAAASLRREGRPVRLAVKKLWMDGTVMKQILYIGLPSGIQSIIITFSNVMVQYYINGFGETAVAAFATYYKVENFVYLPIMAFGQAITTFSGQNAGAGYFRRVRRGTVLTALMGAGVTFCVAGLILLFPDTAFGWFIKDRDVVKDALKIAFVSFPFYWIYPIMEVASGSLRGMGYSVSSMTIIILNLCVVRVSLLAVFSARFRTLRSIASVYPITWALAAVCFIVLFLVVIRKKCGEVRKPAEVIF